MYKKYGDFGRPSAPVPTHQDGVRLPLPEPSKCPACDIPGFRINNHVGSALMCRKCAKVWRDPLPK